MRYRLLEPPNGWRAFSFEFVTIVLGVLVALGAQELAQDFHWRRQVTETRHALDAELARDLAAFDQRYNNRPCISARLAELKRWSESVGAGRPLALKGEIQEPPFFSIRTAAWEITDGEIASRIPLSAKLNYAALYDGLRKYDELKQDESEAWSTLAEYGTAKRFDEADRRVIERAFNDIEDFNDGLDAFKTPIDRFAGGLDIRAERSLLGGANPLVSKWQKEACQPLL